MKLTRSKLREIVKEEIENLRESKYDIFVGKHVTGHTVADRSVEDPNTRDYKKLAFVYNDGRVQWYDKAAKKDREVKKTVDKLVKQKNESTRLTDIMTEGSNVEEFTYAVGDLGLDAGGDKRKGDIMVWRRGMNAALEQDVMDLADEYNMTFVDKNQNVLHFRG